VLPTVLAAAGAASLVMALVGSPRHPVLEGLVGAFLLCDGVLRLLALRNPLPGGGATALGVLVMIRLALELAVTAGVLTVYFHLT